MLRDKYDVSGHDQILAKNVKVKADAKILGFVILFRIMQPKMRNLSVSVLNHFTESTVDDGVNDI